MLYQADILSILKLSSTDECKKNYKYNIFSTSKTVTENKC